MNEVFTNDFSKEIWENIYQADEEEKNIQETWLRVSGAIAQAEDSNEKIEYWKNEFYESLEGFKVCPAGRILSNAGNKWAGTTIMNCYTGPKPKYDIDSIDGIYETLRMQAQTLKSEGGWGLNFSFIRPRGSFIHGIGVESPGSVKYMELFNKSSDIITAGSGKQKRGKKKIRKGAQMGIISCWHPDIEEFITSKLTNNRLDKFNISVGIYDEFIKKLEEENDSWDLIFPDTTFPKYKKEWNGDIYRWKAKGYPVIVYRTVSARWLWNLIMETNYKRNDPGVLFLDNANKTHCINYIEDLVIVSSNPCGEQTMPDGFSCDLGSIVLPYFIDFEKKKFDLEKVNKHAKVLCRFLDNVNSVTGVPLPEYKENINKYRRIGCGMMGWGSALYLLGVRFGSDEAEKIKSELMHTFTHAIVEASIDLAEEKGMFPGCMPEKHADHIFWKQIGLPKRLLEKMRKVGMRNSSLFSFQPNGNTGVLVNIMSGGLECVFLHEFWRTVIIHEIPEHIKDVCPNFHQGEFFETDMFKFVKEGEETILRGVDKFGTVYKIDKNRGLTKEVLCEDYAVHLLKEKRQWNPETDWAVTTANLTVEDHLKDLYGWSKWIDSAMSKTVNLPKDYPFEDYKNIYLEAHKHGLKGITTYRAGTMTNVLSAVGSLTISSTNADKRPKLVPAKIYHSISGGLKYFIAIGLLNDEPYECFAGRIDDNSLTHGKQTNFKNGNSGQIVKISRGKYAFVDEESTVIDNLVEYCTDSEEALTRLVSTNLRHCSNLPFVVQQLEKTKGDMQSFAKVIARVLKKFIKDGTQVTGENCIECGSAKLIRQSGCVQCSDCGWSKCT